MASREVQPLVSQEVSDQPSAGARKSTPGRRSVLLAPFAGAAAFVTVQAVGVSAAVAAPTNTPECVLDLVEGI